MEKVAETTRPRQLYIPVHRRATSESNPEQQPKRRQPRTSKDDIVRRGRGQFRAPPSSASTLKAQDHEQENEQTSNAETTLPSFADRTREHCDMDLTEELTSAFEKLSVSSSSSKEESKQSSPEKSPSEKEEWEQLLDLSDDEWELSTARQQPKKESRRPLTGKISNSLRSGTLMGMELTVPMCFKSWRVTTIEYLDEHTRLLRFSILVSNYSSTWHFSRLWKCTRWLQNQMD